MTMLTQFIFEPNKIKIDTIRPRRCVAANLIDSFIDEPKQKLRKEKLRARY